MRLIMENNVKDRNDNTPIWNAVNNKEQNPQNIHKNSSFASSVTNTKSDRQFVFDC